MAEVDYKSALDRLDILVGKWQIETSLELDPSLGPARTTFEWTLDRTFLLHRSEVPMVAAPDSLAIIATDPDSGAYTYHYFDTRGVVRVYEMELDDELWTLERTKADFSELPFGQRYVGRFEEGGNRITGQWEKADAGTNWEIDFELSYTRA
jgi:hypothetical protein